MIGREGVQSMHVKIIAWCFITLVLLAVIEAPTALASSDPKPLIDMGSDTYTGFNGGLYPDGTNDPPAHHADAAIQQSSHILPRNADGQIDPRGVIGFVSIGMSNTFQEFKVFERVEDMQPARHARVVIVNGAMGGQSADVIANPNSQYWTNLDDRISAAGLAPEQVQVIWLKQAQAQPLLDFPDHALSLKSELRTIAQILKNRFPNLRLCYLSSRIYGGYSQNPLRNEPLSYETGFAVSG